MFKSPNLEGKRERGGETKTEREREKKKRWKRGLRGKKRTEVGRERE